MNKNSEMQELVQTLREASRAYYMGTHEIMSNLEYDKQYDRLVRLETETGIVLSGSPSTFVGYEVVSSLEKETHEFPALSLDKTKERDVLKKWLGGKEGVISPKCDGLTCQITFDDGRLVKGLTRGNSLIGEKLTTVSFFRGVPSQITYKGHLVVRGEALITYAEFERINSSILLDEDKYKNPRNLASGTIRQLDNRICGERTVDFVAFELVYPEPRTYMEAFTELENNGFQVVDHILVDTDSLDEAIDDFKIHIPGNPFPTDGLVLAYNDVAYGRSLPSSSKTSPGSLAFKWQDTELPTILRSIEWSASRTGLLNPVAVFDPIELEGTTVSRASVHNMSIIRKLELGIGDEIMVMKANMIIPQVSDNITRSGTIKQPETCPVCGGGTQLRFSNDTITVICPASDCAAKNLYAFVHFVGRDAMNIEGLSESKLEKLISIGAISCFADLYDIKKHRSQICNLEGFGEKSYDNLYEAIEKSRTVQFSNLLYALGISNVGRDASKKIGKDVRYDFDELRRRLRTEQHFDHLEGIGPIIDGCLFEWYSNLSANFTAARNLENLLASLTIELPKTNTSQGLSGKIFVITGSVEKFTNRDALVKFIESKGGRVSGSVSAKTSYLINNDNLSGSTKNKAAQTLNVPILTEEMFLAIVE